MIQSSAEVRQRYGTEDAILETSDNVFVYRPSVEEPEAEQWRDASRFSWYERIWGFVKSRAK